MYYHVTNDYRISAAVERLLLAGPGDGTTGKGQGGRRVAVSVVGKDAAPSIPDNGDINTSPILSRKRRLVVQKGTTNKKPAKSTRAHTPTDHGSTPAQMSREHTGAAGASNWLPQQMEDIVRSVLREWGLGSINHPQGQDPNQVQWNIAPQALAPSLQRGPWTM